jgi:tRNA splicing ligase
METSNNPEQQKTNICMVRGGITQFASMLDKNAMRYMKQRYFGATNERNDVKYVSSFLDNDSELTKKLKVLAHGVFIYNYNGNSRLEIRAYKKFHILESRE